MSPVKSSAAEIYMGEMEELSAAPRKIPSLKSLFHILWLRKWTVLAAWLVLALPTGLTLSIINLPKVYLATTVLRFPDVVGAQTNVMRDVAIAQGQSIISIFNSYQVLEATVRKLGLRMRVTTDDVFQHGVFRNIHFNENLGLGVYTVFLRGEDRTAKIIFHPRGTTAEFEVFSGRLGPDGRIALPGLDLEFQPDFLRKGKDMKLDLDLRTLEQTGVSLKKALATKPLGGGNYEIRLRDRDPQMVAEILNTLREQFLDVYYGTTEVQDVGILVQMEKDLELAKEKLEKGQDELSRYYASHPELNQQQGASGGDNLAYLESRQEIDRLQQQKRRVEEAMAAKEADATPEKKFYWASELLNAMGQAGEPKANILRASLQELNARQVGFRGNLGPDHPKIREVEKDKEVIYRQIEDAENLLTRKLDQDLADLRGRMASSAPRGSYRPAVKVTLELERLTNTNENNQRIYDRLMESYNRAKLVTGSEFFKVTVVDPARPAQYEPPSLRTRLLFAAGAMFLLLLVVPAGFLFWPVLFIRIWTKDDVQRLLGLRTLGEVSLRVRSKSDLPEPDRKPGSKQGEPDPLLLFHGRDHQLEDVEVFRLIREESENLFKNPATPGRLCLMVTSCHPHEGKSTCASNLAVTFARKGKRTLLVDADFRLGRVHRIFNLSVNVGLDDIMSQQNTSLAQFLETATLAFQTTMQSNLVVAPRKASNPNAGEMVSSDRFKAFIKMAREQFEIVVIDTPPVMITPEPLSLAEGTDGVIFVCRSGLTTAGEAREAVQSLGERGVKVAAILNGVRDTPFQRNRYHKYAYYYHVQPKPGDKGA